MKTKLKRVIKGPILFSLAFFGPGLEPRGAPPQRYVFDFDTESH